MTVKISNSLALLAIVGGMAALRAADPVSDNAVQLRIGDFYTASVIVGGVPRLNVMEKVLREHSPMLKNVSVIRAFPDKLTAERILPGKGHSDVTESEWYRMYKRVATTDEDMGEVIKIGVDTLIRSVHGGIVEQRLVNGRDPLTCSPSLLGCKILWINVRDVPPLLKSRFRQPLVEMFVKENELTTVTKALETSKLLQERFGTDLLVVTFRSDEWFTSHDLFPVVYPFMSPRRIVKLGEVHSSDEVNCTSLGGEMRCGQEPSAN
jgi:hypothetical protein